MAAWIDSSSMIWSTISRFSAKAWSPAFSKRLNSASTVLWSSLSSVMASMVCSGYPTRSLANVYP